MLTRRPKKEPTLPASELTKPDFYVGIDPGVNTGMAIWDRKEKKFLSIQTGSIIKIMDDVRSLMFFGMDTYFFRIEDARKRKWFGNAGREQLQGAGSIKRDCQILEEFFNSIGANYELVAPKNNKTKLDAEAFKKITRWTERTNVHGRDASMLVFGL